MTPLKDLYSPEFYRKLSAIFETVIPSFDKKLFIKKIFSGAFEQMELKARMRHTAVTLHHFMPGDFGQAVKLISKIIIKLRKENFGEGTLEFMFLPDYIEIYGGDDPDHSIQALELVTQFVSCEFAVRPFIIRYPEKMMTQLLKWSTHDSAKVRRLASEGSRPRLPWAMAIPALKKDPSPLIPILENLKNDVSDSVRRSVANNLNDISKDHPQLVLKLAKKWKGLSNQTDAVIKHGSRTLLKQGNADVLKHYGLESKNIEVTDLKIATPEIAVGDNLEFSFSVENKNKSAQKIRLEYAIYYQKKKGHLAKKVYKISERMYSANEKSLIAKKQKFVLITTRTFHAGRHQLSIIVNGKENAAKDFMLHH